MKHFVIFASTLMLLILLSVSGVWAEEQPGRWNLDLKGGVTSGHFTFDSRITGQGGFNLRYSMSPMISFYGTFEAGQFSASDEIMNQTGFTNDYFITGLGTRVNVLRMFSGSSRATERFAMYTTAGINLLRSDVRVNNLNYPGYAAKNYTGMAMILRAGIGAAFRVSNRIDLFLQTELNHSDSDLLDGYERIPGSGMNTGWISGGDSFVNTSVGISLKLGGTGVRHTDWHDGDYRSGTASSPALEAEISRMKAELERSDRIKQQFAERLQSLNQTLNEFNHLFTTTYQDQLASHDRQLQNLQDRMDMIQSESDEPSTTTVVQDQDTAENRFFIVAGVFRNRDNAERLREQLLAEGFVRAAIRTDTERDLHVVVYSSHPTREQADTELSRIRIEVNPDSWIFVR